MLAGGTDPQNGQQVSPSACPLYQPSSRILGDLGVSYTSTCELG